MVKDEPEEKENPSDVALFVFRHSFFFFFCSKILYSKQVLREDYGGLRLRLSAYRGKQKIYLKL